MSTEMDTTPKRWRRFGGAAGLIAGGVVAGGILAGTFSASAATTTAPAPASSSSTSATASADQSQPQRSDEKLLTGDTKAKVEAAVLAKYAGATIVRTETDSDGVYESHIVTTAGQATIVQVGKDYTVTGTQTGGPGGHGGHGGAPGSSSTGG
jgi:hypothetical protein